MYVITVHERNTQTERQTDGQDCNANSASHGNEWFSAAAISLFIPQFLHSTDFMIVL